MNERTNLFTEPLRLMHVAPWYSLSRLLTKMPSIDFVGIDIEDRPHVSHRADVTDLPFDSDTFDAIICIHVLEHVEEDRMAMREMFRVLRPGGWALISVPIDLSRPTYEDPAIVSPGQRRIHFGEAGHVRLYGADLGDRLKETGFSVELDHAADLALETMEQYGLMDDENVFYCTKPR